MDPRESNRGTRRKSKWVQDLIKDTPAVAQEVEHVVGRDQAVVMEEKSTIPASYAPAIKKSATIAQNSKKEEEDNHMEAEFAEKLKEIQQGIEINQNKQIKILNQLFTSAKEVLDCDRVKIASLEADNRYYSRLSEDVAELKKQLKTYKRMFWSTIGTLTIVLILYLLIT